MADEAAAAQAAAELDGKQCEALWRRYLAVKPAKQLNAAEAAAAAMSIVDTADSADVTVPGLHVLPDFVTEDEETALLRECHALPAASDEVDGDMPRPASDGWEDLLARRVRHYGYRFNYSTRGVDGIDTTSDGAAGGAGGGGSEGLAGGGAADAPTAPVPPFPPRVAEIASRIAATGLLPVDGPPDQMTLNEYLPGRGIAPHVDTHSAFEDGLCSLSLGAPIVMQFRHSDGRSKQLDLPRRSLLVLTGAARYDWEHHIAARRTDIVDGVVRKRERRVSFTFRRVRRRPCTECGFPSRCDSALSGAAAAAAPVAAAPEIEREHVHKLYDAIAKHFSHTRYAGWPRIDRYIGTLAPGTVLADIGCGNGKYLGANKGILSVGLDRSEPLARICRERGHEVMVSDAVQVPFRSGCADVAISIAVLHHLSTEARRLAALTELVRLVRPGGEVLVSVWAKEQDEASRRRFAAQDVMVPWCLSKKFVDDEATDDAHGVRDEERNVVVFNRYCHVFCEGELQSLASRIPGVTVVTGWYDRSNWVVLLAREGGAAVRHEPEQWMEVVAETGADATPSTGGGGAPEKAAPTGDGGQTN